MKTDDLEVMIMLGYIRDDDQIHIPSKETTLESKDDEIVMLRIFFRVGLRLPIYRMIAGILKKYHIYMHQLMLNAIVRLNFFI
jgi:hypothetical protein